MREERVRTATVGSPEWIEAAARPVPERVQAWAPQVGGHAPGAPAHGASGHGARVAHDASTAAPRSGLWRSARRWLRDAVIGLAIITSFPLAVIAARGDPLPLDRSRLSARLAQVEKLRVLRVPTNSELTPLAAGQLWHATDVVPDNGMFPTQRAAPPAERSWQQVPLTADMFIGVARGQTHVLQSPDVLQAATRALSDAERQYLRVVAEAPIWRDVDRLASAPAIDVLGARYTLPFRADASPMFLPVPRFASTRELAYAGLARAAYHVSQGEPARAEQALRSVLSYGFAMLDNGSSVLEGLVGRVVVGIAGEGLHTLYTITGNASGAALTAPVADPPSTLSGVRSETRRGATEAQLIATAGDPTAARTLRFESLYMLAFSSCTSVRGVLFGPSTASKAAFEEARRSLARYPSERALLDLLEDAPNRPLGDASLDSKSDWLLLGAASVASTVLHNPRVLACTRVMNATR